MEYLVGIEKAGRGYSAYIPDVPGCVATGTTPEKVRARLAEALQMRLADSQRMDFRNHRHQRYLML